MGLSCSTQVSNSPVDQQNALVEAELKRMEEEEKNHFKILLLGAGESGKSTVVKQVKLIYKGNVSKKEIEEYRTAIRRNCIECMQVRCEVTGSGGRWEGAICGVAAYLWKRCRPCLALGARHCRCCKHCLLLACVLVYGAEEQSKIKCASTQTAHTAASFSSPIHSCFVFSYVYHLNLTFRQRNVPRVLRH